MHDVRLFYGVVFRNVMQPVTSAVNETYRSVASQQMAAPVTGAR